MSLFTASTSAEVNELVRQGHDINKYDHVMKTPLFRACENNNFEVINALCILGADVNTAHYGKIPVNRCCYEGNLDVVELLVSFGADINKTDNHGLNALDNAVHGGFLEITKYLVETCH
jgi:uncharacterized protein